jgi:A/G-specific adenine glycosylase
MDKRHFSDKLVEWYEPNKRNLPWRETKDPYKIWLSEVILQQTRVIQGLPYYLKFVEKFPDVRALAAASEQEVLRLWQGLGYYTRARNLHQCAKTW